MTCEEIRDAWQQGAPLPPDVAEHRRQCVACDALLELPSWTRSTADASAAEPLTPFTPPPDTGLERLRGWPTGRRRALTVAIALLSLVVVAAVALRVDLMVYPVGRFAALVALWLGGVLLGVWRSLRPVWQPPLATWQRLVLLGLGLGLALGSVPWGPAHRDHPASLAGLGDELLPRALGCFVLGVGVALPVLLLGWALARDAQRGRGSALWMGIAGASASLLALHLHCPIVWPEHAWLGHVSAAVTVLVVYAGVFALAARHGSRA